MDAWPTWAVLAVGFAAGFLCVLAALLVLVHYLTRRLD
jgi:allophanate hydrolase subunit 1